MRSMSSSDKPLVWLAGEIKTPPFSGKARLEAGLLLRRIQRGENIGMPHSRPMPGIGAGCHELRIQDGNRSWRIAYFVDTDAIAILDVFAKTAHRTPKPILDVCKARLKLYRTK